MAGSVIDATAHKFATGSKILPDANIWLYCFPPPSDPNCPPEITTYTRVIKRIVDAKCEIVLHPLVLGEYLNRYSVIEWRANGANRPIDKYARRSNEYRSYVKEAAQYGRQIAKMSKAVDLMFASLPIDELLNKFEAGNSDWNDQLIGTTCGANGCLLLTHDGDFGDSKLDILTSNKKLLEVGVKKS